MADVVAVLLFTGVIAYCVLGGADFGAGFWDLTAGTAQRGREPRDLIDSSVSPVWEANHIWLIYCLVFLWSGFPIAFTGITTTLYLPLIFVALGIVLRGTGFAFRKASVGIPQQRLYGAAFALSSVLTPFFLGAIAGALASGRVPAQGNGDPIGSWVNPTSALGGVLAVLACAYLAATYLTVAAHRLSEDLLFRYFRARALTSGIVIGAVSVVGVVVLRVDAPHLFSNLTHRGLPMLVSATVCGLLGLSLLWTKRLGGLREVAAAAVALAAGGWGVSQYPDLLGTHLSIQEAASPSATLGVLIGVAGVAVVLILPSFVLLFRLAGRDDVSSRPR